MNRPTRAFISYNKADSILAELTAMFLKSEHIDVWFDEWEISAGDSIIQEINTGLDPCTHFFVLWSRNAAKSNWVRKELYSTLSRAIEENLLKAIPIRIDQSPLPPLLRDIKYIKFEENMMEQYREDVIKAVLGIGPKNRYNEAIERAYKRMHETTRYNTLCPRCKGNNHEPYQLADWRDEIYVFTHCLDCDYMWE
jgi:hypothetical protein